MSRFLIQIFVFIFMVVCLPATCIATESSSDALTVEEAIKFALANRDDIKTADLTLQAANIANDLVWEGAEAELEAYRIPGTNQYAGGIDSWNQVYTSEYNLQAAQKNYDTKVESVKFSVYSKYYDVVSALEKNDAQRLSNQQADDQLKISELRYQLGLDTKLTLFQAQQQVSSSKANFALSSQSVEQSYIALMGYIGLPTSERPNLIRELEYRPIDLSDPEGKIADIVKDSPSVWLAKKSLTLTENTSDRSVSLEGELTDINLEKAEINIVSTRDAMVQVTRSIYYNILSLEESYNTSVQSAKAADEALRVAKLLYEVGMGTKLDVTAAEIAAQSAHQAVNSLSYQHAILVMAFEKPWAYGSM